jgi:hypothetical protein
MDVLAILPAKVCESLPECRDARLAVGVGRDLSSPRIRSIIGINGSSFGFAGGFLRM